MPTYQYACTTCGHQLEAVQSFSDEPLTACPQCDGRLRKLFSAVGIVFKGSGFYRTDARNDGRRSSLGSSPRKDKELTSVGSSTSGGEQTNASSSPSKATSTGSTSGTKSSPST